MKLYDLMVALKDANDRCAWNLSTGRHIPVRDMRRAMTMHLAESAGACAAVDGDGFTLQPERYREAFRITPLGRRWLLVAESMPKLNGYPTPSDTAILEHAATLRSENPMVPSYAITEDQFRSLLIMRMCADPTPPNLDTKTLDTLLDEIALDYGHNGWMAAYHAMV